MDDNELQRRIDTALTYLNDRNYTCAQSVACAFADCVGLPEALLYKLDEGCGGGMGCFTETCGTLIAAAQILSCTTSGPMDEPTTKAATFAKLRPLIEAFRKKNGSTRCDELLGPAGKPTPSVCGGYVTDTCTLLAEALDRA